MEEPKVKYMTASMKNIAAAERFRYFVLEIMKRPYDAVIRKIDREGINGVHLGAEIELWGPKWDYNSIYPQNDADQLHEEWYDIDKYYAEYYEKYYELYYLGR